MLEFFQAQGFRLTPDKTRKEIDVSCDDGSGVIRFYFNDRGCLAFLSMTLDPNLYGISVEDGEEYILTVNATNLFWMTEPPPPEIQDRIEAKFKVIQPEIYSKLFALVED
jgi:hypothetical protein